MVDTDSGPDLAGLSAWKIGLARAAEGLRADIHQKQQELAQIEERMTLLTKLIEMESPANSRRSRSNREVDPSEPPTRSHALGRTSMDLEDAAEAIIREAGTPLHISQIRDRLLAQGIPIPGRGDDANIIVRLRRLEDRFTRTARGTYGLAEWAIPPLKNRMHRKHRTPAT